MILPQKILTDNDGCVFNHCLDSDLLTPDVPIVLMFIFKVET